MSPPYRNQSRPSRYPGRSQPSSSFAVARVQRVQLQLCCLGKGAQLRARKLSNASLKAAGFWSGEPCRAFATVINCEPGMQRCAASESTLKNGRVNSPLVIVTGILS